MRTFAVGQRRAMAENAVARHKVSMALACRAFGVSETCYRYSPKLKAENEEIADLLTGLTDARKTWGFGLCFLHLRNVKGYPWNHKRVYRIFCALELNLRIKPRKRLKREKPEALAVPDAPKMTWSMNFMADRLGDPPRPRDPERTRLPPVQRIRRRPVVRSAEEALRAHKRGDRGLEPVAPSVACSSATPR